MDHGAATSGPPEFLLDLERAHDRIHRASRALESIDEPPWDLAPAAEAIEKALERLYVSYDERDERYRAANEADTEVADAIDKLQKLGPVGGQIELAMHALAEARGALAEAQRRLAYLIPREPPAPPPISASRDVPTLHVLTRSALPVKVRIAKPRPVIAEIPAPPAPKSLQELTAMVEEVKKQAKARREANAEKMRKALAPAKPKDEAKPPPPGFVPELPARVAPLAWLGQRARDSLEEIAMIGLQRMPLLGDPFRSVQFLERRMLCALDAIAALGPGALSTLEQLVHDSPIKDPARAFGAAFVFGCIDGRDATAAAERIGRNFGFGKADIADAFANGWKLATSPAVPVVARAWLEDPDPAVRAIAIDVLGYRRLATPRELAQAARDRDARVAQKALPHLAAMNPAETTRELEDAIETAIASDDVALREAGWAAMALSGHMHASTVLQTALSEEALRDRAAIPLAVVGDAHDAARLLELAKAAPTENVLLALGWAGAADAIPFLIQTVGGKKKEHRIAAANALDRITGARLYQQLAVEPEKIEVEEPPEPEVDLDGRKKKKPKPLAQMVSDPRDLPGEGAPDVLELPTIHAPTWQRFWQERREGFHAGHRYRRGHPYTPLVSWWELDQWRVTPFERRMLQRELVVRTGSFVPFDPFDWVPVQEEALKQWESVARSASGHPGVWNRPMRR